MAVPFAAVYVMLWLATEGRVGNCVAISSGIAFSDAPAAILNIKVENSGGS